MATETTVQIPRHLFTVHDYQRMAEVGILHEDDRIELICGEIIEMTPIGDRHAATVARLTAFFGRVPDESILWVQNPVRLSGVSEPQPDVCLIRKRDDYYQMGKPGPADVLLLVEVADTSLAFDRNVKLGLYASAGIPEVWIVDLEGQAIEVYREPRDGAYSKQVVLPRGNRLEPSAFPLLSLSVDEILGPKQS